MPTTIFVADRQSALDAVDLIDRFGREACHEAAMRADESRDRGNVMHFCRWRQIERLVEAMTRATTEQTLH